MIPAWVDGRLTPVDKLEVHQKGLRHKAISVFINCGAETLLQRRALTKYHTPGLWANACCTHPHWDEPPEACAARRLEEELGVKGAAPTHRGQVHYRADVGNGLTEDEVVEIFTLDAPKSLPLAPNPDEVMETRWADTEILAAELAKGAKAYTPWLAIYFARHRALFSGAA